MKKFIIGLALVSIIATPASAQWRGPDIVQGGYYSGSNFSRNGNYGGYSSNIRSSLVGAVALGGVAGCFLIGCGPHLGDRGRDANGQEIEYAKVWDERAHKWVKHWVPVTGTHEAPSSPNDAVVVTDRLYEKVPVYATNTSQAVATSNGCTKAFDSNGTFIGTVCPSK